MKTIDLRPWAVTVLATVYSIVFWIFHSRTSREHADAPRPVWYDELPVGSRPNLQLPPGWTIARADAPAPTPTQPAVTTRAPRIRTRSS